MNTNPIYFKGYRGRSSIVENGKKQELDHYTEFMRNYPTMKFTNDYIVQNFPQGTKISEFGCSTGETMLSRLVLLDKHNQDKKYKATGYDFHHVIKGAKTRIHKISPNNKSEYMLFKIAPRNLSNSSDKKEVNKIRKTFFEYFKPLDKKDLEELSGKEKKASSNLSSHSGDIIVKVKKKKIKDIANFENGNIKNIDTILKPNESGVVVFSNALYHILNSKEISKYKDANINAAENIFQKVHKVLPEKGIFVIGSLPQDHLYYSDLEDKTRLTYQNNEQIRVFDSSRVHNALRRAGLEPIFYEKSSNPCYRQYDNVHLPSVWKKVSHLK